MYRLNVAEKVPPGPAASLAEDLGRTPVPARSSGGLGIAAGLKKDQRSVSELRMWPSHSLTNGLGSAITHATKTDHQSSGRDSVKSL